MGDGKPIGPIGRIGPIPDRRPLPGIYGGIAWDWKPESLCASLREYGIVADAGEDEMVLQVGGLRLRLARREPGEYSVAGCGPEEDALHRAARRLSIVLRCLSLCHRIEVYAEDGRELAANRTGWTMPDTWDDDSDDGIDLTFDEWVCYVFDRPYEFGDDWWEGAPVTVVEYIARLFEGAGDLLAAYSGAQTARGLYTIASSGMCDYACALKDALVPIDLRRRAVRSMGDLFECCLAPRCEPVLSHGPNKGAGPLNDLCYMWYDIMPIHGDPKGGSAGAIDAEMLRAMRRILALPSPACQEAALHGLGHWQVYYPKLAKAIVDEYLQRERGISRALKEYAQVARAGGVL